MRLSHFLAFEPASVPMYSVAVPDAGVYLAYPLPGTISVRYCASCLTHTVVVVRRTVRVLVVVRVVTADRSDCSPHCAYFE